MSKLLAILLFCSCSFGKEPMIQADMKCVWLVGMDSTSRAERYYYYWQDDDHVRYVSESKKRIRYEKGICYQMLIRK